MLNEISDFKGGGSNAGNRAGGRLDAGRWVERHDFSEESPDLSHHAGIKSCPSIVIYSQTIGCVSIRYDDRRIG